MPDAPDTEETQEVWTREEIADAQMDEREDG
jgi:hypothetical protein